MELLQKTFEKYGTTSYKETKKIHTLDLLNNIPIHRPEKIMKRELI